MSLYEDKLSFLTQNYTPKALDVSGNMLRKELMLDAEEVTAHEVYDGDTPAIIDSKGNFKIVREGDGGETYFDAVETDKGTGNYLKDIQNDRYKATQLGHVSRILGKNAKDVTEQELHNYAMYQQNLYVNKLETTDYSYQDEVYDPNKVYLRKKVKDGTKLYFKETGKDKYGRSVGQLFNPNLQNPAITAGSQENLNVNHNPATNYSPLDLAKMSSSAREEHERSIFDFVDKAEASVYSSALALAQYMPDAVLDYVDKGNEVLGRPSLRDIVNSASASKTYADTAAGVNKAYEAEYQQDMNDALEAFKNGDIGKAALLGITNVHNIIAESAVQMGASSLAALGSGGTSIAYGAIVGALDMLARTDQQTKDNNNGEGLSLTEAALTFAAFAATQGVGGSLNQAITKKIFGKAPTKSALDRAVSQLKSVDTPQSNLSRLTTGVAKGYGSEAGQEYLETGIESYASRDKDLGITPLDVATDPETLFGGFLGGIVGGTMAGGAGTAASPIVNAKNKAVTALQEKRRTLTENNNKVDKEFDDTFISTVTELENDTELTGEQKLDKLNSVYDKSKVSVTSSDSYKTLAAKYILEGSATTDLSEEEYLKKHNTSVEKLAADLYRNAPQDTSFEDIVNEVTSTLGYEGKALEAIRRDVTSDFVNIEARYGSKQTGGYYQYIDNVNTISKQLEDNPDDGRLVAKLDRNLQGISNLMYAQESKLEAFIQGFEQLSNDRTKNVNVEAVRAGSKKFSHTLDVSRGILKADPNKGQGTFKVINSIIQDLNAMGYSNTSDMVNRLNEVLNKVYPNKNVNFSATQTAPSIPSIKTNMMNSFLKKVEASKKKSTKVEEKVIESSVTPSNEKEDSKVTSVEKESENQSESQEDTVEVDSIPEVDTTEDTGIVDREEAFNALSKDANAYVNYDTLLLIRDELQPKKDAKTLSSKEELIFNRVITQLGTAISEETHSTLIGYIESMSDLANTQALTEYRNVLTTRLNTLRHAVDTLGTLPSTLASKSNPELWKEYLKVRNKHMFDKLKKVDKSISSLKTLYAQLEGYREAYKEFSNIEQAIEDMYYTTSDFSFSTSALDAYTDTSGDKDTLVKSAVELKRNIINIENSLIKTLEGIPALETARRHTYLFTSRGVDNVPNPINPQKALKAGSNTSLLSIVDLGNPDVFNEVAVSLLVAKGLKPKQGVSERLKQYVESITNKLRNSIDLYDNKDSYGLFVEVVSSQTPGLAIITDVKTNLANNTVKGIDLNTNAAIAIDYAVSDIITNSPNLFTPTEEQLEEAISSTSMSGIKAQFFIENGVPIHNIVDKLGRDILNKLGFVENEEGYNGDYKKIVSSLGNIALIYASESGLVELNKREIELEGTKVNENGEAVPNTRNVTLVKLNTNKISRETQKSVFKSYNDLLNIAKVKIKTYNNSPSKVLRKAVKNMTKMHRVPKIALEVIKGLQNQEHILNVENIKILAENKDMTLQYMGYVKPEDLHKLSYTKFISVTGQEKIFKNGELDLDAIDPDLGSNGSILKEYNELVKAYKAGHNDSIFFEYFYGRNARLYLDSNTLNPQTNKQLHRFLVPPNGVDVEVDMNNSDHVAYVSLAIAQAFDTTGSDIHMQDFTNKFLLIPHSKLLKAFNSGTLEALGNEYGIDLSKMETVGQVLNAIQHAGKHQKAVADGKTKFNTMLVSETDAVTSGYAIRALQMPSESFTTGLNIDEARAEVAKYGISFEYESRTVDELKKDTGLKDKYQSAAQNHIAGEQLINIVKKDDGKVYSPKNKNIDYLYSSKDARLDAHTFINNWLGELYSSLNTSLPKVQADGKVPSALRKLAKAVVMVYGYGAGKYSMASKVVNTISTDFMEGYIKLYDSNLIDDNGQYVGEKTQEGEIVNFFNFMLDAGIKVRNDKGKLFSVSNPEQLNRALLKVKPTDIIITIPNHGTTTLSGVFDIMFRETYGNTLVDSLNVQHEQESQYNSIFNSVFGLIGERFGQIVDEAIAKAETKKGDRLTTKEALQVLSDNKELAPLLPVPIAQLMEDVDTSLRSGETDTISILDDTMYHDETTNVQTNIKSISKTAKGFEQDGLSSGSVSSVPLINKIKAAYTKAAVTSVHSIDAAVLMLTLRDVFKKGGKVLGVHDAIISTLTEVGDNTITYNKALEYVNKHFSTYSVAKDMMINLFNSYIGVKLESELVEEYLHNLHEWDNTNVLYERLEEDGVTLTDEVRKNISSLLKQTAVKDPDEHILNGLTVLDLPISKDPDNPNKREVLTSTANMMSALLMAVDRVEVNRENFFKQWEGSLNNMSSVYGKVHGVQASTQALVDMLSTVKNPTKVEQDMLDKLQNSPNSGKASIVSTEQFQASMATPEGRIEVLRALEGRDNLSTTPEHLKYLEGLLGVLQAPILDEVKVFFGTAVNSAINMGEYIPSTNTIKLGKVSEVTKSMMNETEATNFVHEFLHALIHPFLANYKDQGKVREYRQLLEVQKIASRNTTYMDFLTEADIAEDNPRREKNIEEAQQLVDYLFNNKEGPERALSEFISFALTNEKYIAKLKTIKTKAFKEKSLFGRLGLLFSNFFEALLGTKTFGEVFKTLGDVIAGKANYSDLNKNAYDTVFALVTGLNKVSKKYENKLLAPVKLISQASKLVFDVMQKGDKALSKKLVDFINKNNKEYFPEGLETEGTTVIKTYSALKSFLTSKNVRSTARKTFSLFADVAGINSTHTIRVFARDMIGLDNADSDLEQVALLGATVERERDAMEGATRDVLLEAFGGKLTKVQTEAIAKGILYTDLSSLADVSVDEIKHLLTNEEALQNAIDIETEVIRGDVEGSQNFNEVVGLADLLAIHMVEGKSYEATQFNATSIVKEVGINPDKGVVEAIDRLTTLLAIQHTDVDIRNEVSNLNNEGITEFIANHNLFKRETMEASNLGVDSLLKGYHRTVTDSPYRTVILPKGTIDRKLTKLGTLSSNSNYEVFEDRTQPRLHTDGSAFIDAGSYGVGTTTKELDNVNLSAEAISVLSKVSKDGVLGSAEALTKINRMKDWQKRILRSGKYTQERINKYSQGFTSVTNYYTGNTHYTMNMSHADAEQYLDKNVDGIDTLAKMRGAVVLKNHAEKVNDIVFNTLVDNMSNHITEDLDSDSVPHGWTEISKNSKNKYVNKYYKTLPYNIRKRIESSDKPFIVPDSQLLQVFGVKQSTVVNSKLLKDRNYTLRMVVALAERLWKAIVSFMKTNIVVRTPIVVINNVLSNLMLARSMGMSPIRVMQKQLKVFKDTRVYLQDSRELNKLKLKASSGTATRAEISRIPVLQHSLDTSPVKDLMNAGMYQAVVEDLVVGRTTPIDRLGKFITDRVNVPNTIRNVSSQAFMLQGTQVFDAMQAFVQMSDFIARQAEYEIRLEDYDSNKDTDKSDEAVNAYKRGLRKNILDNYINYNRPTSELAQYLNDIGLLNFIKYPLRIQSVIAKNFVTNPISTMTLVAAQLMFLGFPSPFESFIVGYDPMRNIYNPLDVLTNTLTPASYAIVDDYVI